MELITRFFREPEQSYFLFGPRGTGKSTWLKMRHDDALFIDLLAPEVFREYAARPERLRDVVYAAGSERTIVIDEIQKLPVLLDVVHQLMEEHKGRRFIMTGSSARKLKRSGVDLLAGRAAIKTMHPFMAGELGEGFNLKDALRNGMVPLILNAPEPKEALMAYISLLYLREEVQLEGLIRNIGAFSRFLEAVSFSHGSILTVANVSRECQVERKTVEGYLSILDDLLLSFRVPVFTRKAKRRLSVHPKFYLFDTGVFTALRPKGPLDNASQIHGPALEGLVAQHLRAWCSHRANGCRLFFWRTRSGLEVDFVLYGEDTFWAIEVKNSETIHPKMLNSLLAFKKDYPQAGCLLLYMGKERLMQKGILCMPCNTFLMALMPDISIQEAAGA